MILTRRQPLWTPRHPRGFVGVLGAPGLYVPRRRAASGGATGPDDGGGLLLYYDFDSSHINGSTIYDQSGNGHDGTIYNAGSAAGAKAGLGQSMTFDGSDDYVVVPETSVAAGLSALTIAMWVYPSDAVNNMMFVEDGTAYNQNGFYFYVSTGCKPEFAIYVDGVGNDRVATDAINANEWTHLICTWSSGNRVAIYKNGSTTAEAGTYGGKARTGVLKTGNTPLVVGGRPTATSPYTPTSDMNGRGDELRIYNRVLTEAQRTAVYNWGS